MSVQHFCGEVAEVLRSAAKAMLAECNADAMECQREVARCMEKAARLEAIANNTNIVQGLKDAGIKF